MLAGLAILLTAGLVIGVIAMQDARGDAAPPVSAGSTATPAPDAPGAVRATATANLRAAPDTASAVLAILPPGGEARLLGRTADGAWVRIAYPPDSGVDGWVHAGSLALPPDALAGLPVSANGVAATLTPTPTATAPEDALPDLMIESVFLLSDGRLAVQIRNAGAGSLLDREVPLHVSKASGDILGVLRVGPTTLGPGGTATVVTPVVVTETASYLLVLDRPDEIRESEEFNNSFSALLVPGGG